jgi:hypothetical protein
MNLIPVFNKNLPQAHRESDSSLIKNKKLKKNYFSLHKLPKQQATSFWSQGILGVKNDKNEILITTRALCIYRYLVNACLWLKTCSE